MISVEFYNSQYGWINTFAYDEGLFFRTIDGGNTWITLTTYKPSTSFSDSMNGWGYRLGSIARTYDGGVKWTNISVAGGTGVSKIFFMDTLTGFKYIHAYGSFGSFVSHDGGYNWTVTNLGDDTGANDVYFLDALNGWAVSYSSIWKLDGINNWIQIELVGVPENDNLESIIKCFPNPFSEVVHIEYEIKNPAPFSIQVFNAVGVMVAELSDGIPAKGKHQITWNVVDLPVGLYFVRLIA